MNYLDLLRSNKGFAEQSGQPMAPGAGGPLPAFMTLGQPAPVEPAPMAPAPVPQMAPAPVMHAPAPAVQEANPFDQFDEQTAPQATPTAVPAAPAPVAAPSPSPAPQTAPEAMRNPWAQTVEGDPAFIAATQAYQDDLARLVNSGATKEQIMARYEKEKLRDPSLGISGVDEALAYRDAHPGSVIPVGLNAKLGEAPLPQDTHGPDKGMLDAAGVSLGTGIFMNGLDELGGIVGATSNSVQGVFGGGTGESWTDAYGRISDENRQTMEDAKHYNPGTFLTGELVGNLLTAPIGAARGAAGLGRVIAESAAQGAVNGFNSGVGLEDRLKTGALGGVVGAAGGAVIGGPMNALARRIATNRAGGAGSAVIEAADRLNRVGTGAEITGEAAIRPLVGQVSNGGFGSQAQAFLQPTLVGGMPFMGGLWRKQGNFEQAVEGAANRIANDAAGGTAMPLTDAAAIANNPNVRGSLGAYASNTEDAARAVYRQAEAAADGVRVPAPSAVRKIDEIIERLGRETPGDIPGLEALRTLRADLVRGPDGGTTSAGWTIEGLRRLRTSFGDNLDSTARTVRQYANEIWGPLSDDVFRGLRVAGRPDAARMYRAADGMWARRSAGMEVIERVIGKDADLSADAVAGRINSMSKRDYVHLARALNEIDPAQAAQLRGGLISSLGRPQASRATEEFGFSLESFATRWTDMSNHAKRALYSPQTVTDLNDLATLARANRAVGQLGNPSRSGIMMMNYNQAKTGAGMIGNALSAGTLMAGQWTALAGAIGLSRVLGSPGVARALVRGARSGKVEVAARALQAAATRTPTAAQDILQFRDALTGSTPDYAPVTTAPGQPAAVTPAAPIPEGEGVAPIDPAMTPEENPFDQFGEG